MKRLLILGALAIVLVPGAVLADVATTPHDLSSHLTGSTDICVFCHTPHGGQTNGPLWNHEDSVFGGADYGSYISNTMDATAGTFAPNAANPSSNCLSCHDGTVGVGNLFNDPNGATANALTGVTMGNAPLTNTSANLGTTLSNDHPVNFIYQDSIDNGDTELHTFVTVDAALPFFGAGNDELHCATCHDPHDNTNVPFLTVDNTSSGLCSTCHMK